MKAVRYRDELFYHREVEDIDARIFYRCPTCSLFVTDDRPCHLAFNEKEITSDWPDGKVHKWYYLPHYLKAGRDMVRVPVVSDGVYNYSVNCLFPEFLAAEFAKGAITDVFRP